MVSETLQEIVDHFAAAFGIRILFYSPEGEQMAVGLNSPDSPFCSIIQEKVYCREKCMLMDTEMRLKAKKEKRCISYQCHAGLMEAIHPIFINDILAGYVMIGQYRLAEQLCEQVKKDAEKKGTLKELKKAFLQTPLIPLKRLDHILGLLTLIVDYVISKEIVSLQGNVMIGKILARVENQPDKKLGLKDAARFIGKSESWVSHEFKAKLGMTFLEAIIRKKLDLADELLRCRPDLSIEQISEQLGFCDRFYFSRVYKQHRKETPSEYRKKSSLPL